MVGLITDRTLSFKDRIIGVYILKDPFSNDCYVGSSINCIKRIANHLSALKSNKHKNKLLQAIFNNIGTLEPYIIWTTTEKMFAKHPWMLREVEEDFIDDLPGKRFNLTNLTQNCAQDPKVRKKMSKSSKGKKISEEQRKKISNTLTGRKWTVKERTNHKKSYTLEIRKKMSMAKLGKKLSNKHIRNIIIAKNNLSLEKKAEQYARHKAIMNSPEIKEKMRLSHLGKKESKETIAKKRACWTLEKRKEMSERKRSCKRTKEQEKRHKIAMRNSEVRKKISLAGIGRPCSKETRIKMSLAQKRRYI